ncbi:MAG: hypothetical protein ABI211_24790 [Vicinamibacterales bacterium]
MSLQEDELRSLVRQSVARVLGQQAFDDTPPPPAGASTDRHPHAAGSADCHPPAAGSADRHPHPAGSADRHASHHRYALPEAGGACLIEPTVPCTHCGYCQSHGH